MNYDWDFSVLRGQTIAIIHGVVVTGELTALVVVTGTMLGIAYAVCHRLAPRPFKPILLLGMDLLRSMPVYVLVLFCAYVLPAVVTVLQGVSPFFLAWIALSLYLAAMVADVVRGALTSVPFGAIDAGRAIGLSTRSVLFRIELPIALRATLPTHSLLWIGMLKNSSIAAVIGVGELARVADNIASNTHRGPEAFTVVAACFVLIVLPFSLVARRLEVRLASPRGAVAE